MGTSLYDQYLKETGGPTKPPAAPAPLPAPPPIAAPDITRVAPRPAAPAPTEPLINRVARVNKAVRKALPLTGPLQQLEEGATKFGETTGYDLEAKRAQAGYAKAHPESQRAQQEQIVNTAMLALQFGTGGAGEALPAKRALSDVPFEAYSRLEHAVDKAPFERGTAEQWKAALTPNVAAGERSWRGLDNLLEKKKGQVISRAELQGHLAENPIKVRASTYGGKEPVEYDEWRKEAHNAGWSIRPASRYDGARGVTVKGFVIERPDGIGVDFSPTRDIGAVRNARRRALRSEGDDEESPIVMQLDDIIARMRRGEPFPQAASASLAQLTSDMGGDRGPANIVAQFLGGSYNPRAPGGVPNQSFSLKGIPEGPQPLWAVGAAGAGTALALQQGGDDKDKGGDLYKQFQAEQQKEGGDLYAQFKAEQPKPSVWDRLKSINAGVRQALVPDALQQLETGAAKFGKEQGEWGVQLAKDLKYVIDPARKAESGRPPTEETKAVDRRILFALATVAMPAGVRKIFEDWVIARGIRPPAPPSAGAPPVSPAAAERPTWDRSATAPPPVDQPQPLRPEQQALRARLATEGITPAGAIRRRPPTAPPPVEPGPEAQTFSTKGAVRRPAAAAPPVEAATERRAEPRAPGDVWTPEQRAAYVLEQQRKFVQSTGNKLWSQWTPEEKAAYFADQDRVRAEIAAARAAVGPEEFQRRAIAAAAEAPGPQKMEAIAGAAHDIVAGETAHFPPEPKPGDLTPVVSSNSEFAARPGVMRDVNKGQQPAALNSPLRLPEPTPEDRAIVQPKGYKEISPEEVAARKPAPVVEATPKTPQPATVDENGLFFEHRTPGGELRDFRRVSTEGLIKAHREMQEQIGRDQQLAIYRTIENENMSGTGDRTMFQAATKTARGTSQQAEAAERLRNYQKVMDRLDAELTSRGMSSDDVYNAIQRQEEHEGAIEQEAIHHADLEDEAGTAFDFGDEEPTAAGGRTKSVAEKEPPISDVLNVAKLNLGSKTAEQRMAAKLEEFRAQREANKQTFAEADVNRAEILNELRAGDPIALLTEKAKKLSGEELLARRDLVRENDQIIHGLSKRLEEAATPQEHADTATLLEKAVAHNDALLSDLVTGSSQKGRDLNLLRRMAQQSLDPDVWRVQAKRMLGDRPLTAEVDAMIRKLLQEATDACG